MHLIVYILVNKVLSNYKKKVILYVYPLKIFQEYVIKVCNPYLAKNLI